MVNNITFRSILKNKNRKVPKKNIKTQIIKKKVNTKNISTVDIESITASLLTNKMKNLVLDNIIYIKKEKPVILSSEKIDYPIKKYYNKQMVIVPVLLDNKDVHHYTALKYVDYGIYYIYIVLQKNMMLELYDEEEITTLTINKYYPSIKHVDVKDIKNQLLDNGLKIYTVLLKYYIPDIKLQIHNLIDKYEWAQFNVMIQISSLENNENILEYLFKLNLLNYKYDILNFKLKIDNDNIHIYDILKCLLDKDNLNNK
jgi:hypothetical protein